MRSTLALVLLLAAACGEVTANGNDNPPPAIESVSPDRGGTPGGHTITITGSGFTDNDAGDNYVVVGDIAATDVLAEDDATLTFTLPPGPAPDAVVDLTVFNSNGFTVLPDAIQYSPFPVVLSLSHATVRSSGDDITIFGSGFESFDAGENVVTIGGQEATSVEVVSDTELAVEVAPRPDEIAAFTHLDVVVSNANGSSTLAGAFRYTKQGILRIGWDRGLFTTVSFLDIDGDEVEEIPVSTTSVTVGSAALANNGRIYITTGGPSRVGPTRTLATLDPITGVVQFIGTLEGTPTDNVRKIAFSNGKLYGMLRDNRQLAEIDLDTGEYSAIGAQNAYPESTAQGMGRRNDSSLWVASNTNGGILYSASVSDSTAVAGPTLTGEIGTSIYSLLSVGGVLYGTTRDSAAPGQSGSSLIRIDTSTGEVEALAQLFGHSSLVPTPPLF